MSSSDYAIFRPYRQITLSYQYRTISIPGPCVAKTVTLDENYCVPLSLCYEVYVDSIHLKGRCLSLTSMRLRQTKPTKLR